MRSHLNFLLVINTAGLITYFSVRPLPTYVVADGMNLSIIYHGLAYFALAGVLLLYFHDTRKGHIEAILTAAGFGLCLELVQLFLVTRHFSPQDISVNLVGASIILLNHRVSLIHRIIQIEDQFLNKLFTMD